MTAHQVLSHLTAAGIWLSADGENLRAGPREVLDDEARHLIRAHKPALLALLQQGAEPLPPLSSADHAAIRESIEERAAIQQFDGGLSRQEAETEARAAMRVYRVRVAMPDGRAPRWATMLAPNCDLGEARRAACGTFGADRVLDVIPEPAQAEATR
jgi:hypothetical protein